MRTGSLPPHRTPPPWQQAAYSLPVVPAYATRASVAYRTEAACHPGLLQCLTCWRWLEPEWFYRSSKVRDGRRSLCKECEWRRYCSGKRRPPRYAALGPTPETEQEGAG